MSTEIATTTTTTTNITPETGTQQTTGTAVELTVATTPIAPTPLPAPPVGPPPAVTTTAPQAPPPTTAVPAAAPCPPVVVAAAPVAVQQPPVPQAAPPTVQVAPAVAAVPPPAPVVAAAPAPIAVVPAAAPVAVAAHVSPITAPAPQPCPPKTSVPAAIGVPVQPVAVAAAPIAAVPAAIQSPAAAVAPAPPAAPIPTPAGPQVAAATPAPAAVAPPGQATVAATTTATAATTTGRAKAKSSKKGSKSRKTPAVTMATAEKASNAGSTGGENTGRWTAEEHRLFLQGLDQHGKGWKKIASLIKSRTVVQIRTHAQKYFQKLAKARQNGEEGDVAMEGRGGLLGAPGGPSGVPGHGGTSAGAPKKKRQLSGTKRKSISNVVSSVTREAKAQSKASTVAAAAATKVEGTVHGMPPSKQAKVVAAAPASTVPTIKAAPPPPTLPSVAPALAPFVVSPPAAPQPTLTPAMLEDSLYRFLTPVTGDSVFTDPSVPSNNNGATSGEVAAPATTITVPQETGAHFNAVSEGEASPTCVMDITFPTFDPKEPPQWYAKGADVEDLLDEADTLEWLADSGDLEETYNLSSKMCQTTTATISPAPVTAQVAQEPAPVVTYPVPVQSSEMGSMCSTSDSGSDDTDVAPTVVSIQSNHNLGKPTISAASISTDNGMMTLPALFGEQQPSQTQFHDQPDVTMSDPPSNVKTTLVEDVVQAPASVYSSATEAVEATLPEVTSTAHMNDELAVFDTAFDEQAFVSALLEGGADGPSSPSLPVSSVNLTASLT